MNTSTDVEKTFNKNQNLLRRKILNKLGTEEMFPNKVKATYDKLTSNVILNVRS